MPIGPRGLAEQSAYYLRVDRAGRLWKLVRGVTRGAMLADELYEVTSDPAEAHDLLIAAHQGAANNPGGHEAEAIYAEYERLRYDYAALAR